MAIQVGGTTVINNSRALSNIASVDATTAAAIEAAGVGGGGGFPIWDPTSTPDVTLTSSGSWTKPSLSDGSWILVYMVGGGGAGTVEGNNWANGGGAGGAHIFSGQATEFPSSVSFTVGAGGTPNGGSGGTTSCVIQGKTYQAGGGTGGNNGTNIPSPGAGGSSAVVYSGIAPFETLPASEGTSTQDRILAGAQNQVFGAGNNSVYGGASGGTGKDSGFVGGTSTYAGNGGSGITSQEKNGGFPGGGGGGRRSGAAGTGGAGVVKIWYIGD